MRHAFCADISHNKFMRINFVGRLATETQQGKSNTKVYAHKLFGASELQVLGLGCPIVWLGLREV